MPETPNLERTTKEFVDKRRLDSLINLDRESQSAFNTMSLAGLIGGALVLYTGARCGCAELEGCGYGILIMNGLMNGVSRGLRYLQCRREETQ